MIGLAPGSTLGVLGGGQLGRMFAHAAQALGYHVLVFTPERAGCAAQAADGAVVAPWSEVQALGRFAQQVQAVTYEFENVPVEAATWLAERVPVHPSPRVLADAQDRLREKQAVRGAGLGTVDFAEVASAEQAAAVAGSFRFPARLKTSRSGYDGRGQAVVASPGGLVGAWRSVGAVPCVLEAHAPFVRELSVVVARGQDGQVRVVGPVENEHVGGILDLSVLPAAVTPEVASAAREVGRTLVEAWEVVGVLCVELFELADGTLLVNEVAPRPHNSGHLTLETHLVSQFEQQVRAVAGLPLGVDVARSPAAMVNLLGHLWAQGEPRWERALALPGVRLHLYGKADPRPGRKMGHLTVLADDPAEARGLALQARARLLSG